MMTTSPGLSSGLSTCSTYAVKTSPEVAALIVAMAISPDRDSAPISVIT